MWEGGMSEVSLTMTISLFFFPLFSSQGLAAHGSCNSLHCCPCPLCHVKVEAQLVSEGLKPLYSFWVTKVPLPSIVSLKSNEPSLGEAWGSCLSAHRSVPKSRHTGGRELDGLVWIQSWPGSEEGPAMQRESNRTSRCVHVCVCLTVVLPSDVAGVCRRWGMNPVSLPLSPSL